MPVKRTLLLTLSIWSIVIDPYTFTICIFNIFFFSIISIHTEHWLVNTQCNTLRRKHICWIYYSNLINTQNKQQIISNSINLHFTLFGILSYRYSTVHIWYTVLSYDDDQVLATKKELIVSEFTVWNMLNWQSTLSAKNISTPEVTGTIRSYN